MPSVMRKVKQIPANPRHVVREREEEFQEEYDDDAAEVARADASVRREIERAEKERSGAISRGLRHRFRDLARARTSACVAAMDYLEQLAVRSRYHYTDDEAQAILSALGDKLEELTEAFARGTGRSYGFKFPDESGSGAA